MIRCISIFQYHDTTKAISSLKSLTNNSILLGLDTIAEGDSAKICLESFATEGEGRKLDFLLPPSEEAKKQAKELGVELQNSLAYSLLGKVSVSFSFPPAFF